jgi:hypothetical protein
MLSNVYKFAALFSTVDLIQNTKLFYEIYFRTLANVYG